MLYLWWCWYMRSYFMEAVNADFREDVRLPRALFLR